MYQYRTIEAPEIAPDDSIGRRGLHEREAAGRANLDDVEHDAARHANHRKPDGNPEGRLPALSVERPKPRRRHVGGV